MGPAPSTREELVHRVYARAANLLVHQKQSEAKGISALVNEGLDYENASTVVATRQAEITKAQKSRANKDMLYGAFWCIDGTVLTVANTGFIFLALSFLAPLNFLKDWQTC